VPISRCYSSAKTTSLIIHLPEQGVGYAKIDSILSVQEPWKTPEAPYFPNNLATPQGQFE
jgi:hypothetical protein